MGENEEKDVDADIVTSPKRFILYRDDMEC